MKTGRRNESLIPLSREHHYGLLVCLRIHRGLESHQADLRWLSERAEKAVRFFESDLKTHFEVEEKFVFPAMSGIQEATSTIEDLVGEHRSLAKLVAELSEERGPKLAILLGKFAQVLEAHIRKEERILFPCYELNISSAKASQVKSQVLEALGSALKPKHPELLE
jgi:iron-sulfur cluster repair protein YtfE (RIC family)